LFLSSFYFSFLVETKKIQQIKKHLVFVPNIHSVPSFVFSFPRFSNSLKVKGLFLMISLSIWNNMQKERGARKAGAWVVVRGWGGGGVGVWGGGGCGWGGGGRVARVSREVFLFDGSAACSQELLSSGETVRPVQFSRKSGFRRALVGWGRDEGDLARACGNF
jgi:hypothetical protein